MAQYYNLKIKLVSPASNACLIILLPETASLINDISAAYQTQMFTCLQTFTPNATMSRELLE